MIIKKHTKISLYALNFLAFFAISTVHTQMIPFLSKVGYDVIKRGYILAGSAVVAILGQFLFGYLCDKFKRTRIFFLLAYVLLLISSFAMFLMKKQVFFYHLGFVSLMGGMVKVIMGLDETWMLEIDSENYGKLRASGALGLTIGSLIAGYLLRRFHEVALLIMFGGVSCLLLFFIKTAKDAKHKNSEAIQVASLKKLVKNKRYILLVLIYLFVYMIGTADQYVVIDKMMKLHAGNSLIGIKWALQSFMEVPLFLFATQILNKWKTNTLLLFGTLMYALKFVLYGFFQTPWLLIISASLQLVTLPIIMLTSKVLIKKVTPEKLFNSAQMFAMAIFIGVSGLLTPLFTSHLSKVFGYDCTLYIVAAFALLPFILIIYYHMHYEKRM